MTNRRAFARDPACPVGRAMLAAAAARSMTEAALPLHLLHVLRTFTPTSEHGLLSRRRRGRSFRFDFFSFPFRSIGFSSREIVGHVLDDSMTRSDVKLSGSLRLSVDARSNLLSLLISHLT